MRRSENGGTGGETRSSGLWGTGRGGRGSDGRNATLKRGLLALVVLALAAPLAASAGSGERDAHGDSYLAPALQTAASSTPNADVRVIVHSDRGAGKAQDALEEFADHDSTRLPIVDAAAGPVRAGDLPDLAEASGLVIVPDTPVGLDGLHGFKDTKEKRKLPRGHSPQTSLPASSGPGRRRRQPLAVAARRTPESAAGRESLHRVHRFRDRRVAQRFRRPHPRAGGHDLPPGTRPATGAATAPSWRAPRRR